MSARLRHGARIVLSLLLLASVASWAVRARELLTHPLAVDAAHRGLAIIEAEILRQTQRTVTPEWVDTRMSEALAAHPRDWPRIEVIRELAADHGIVLSPATQTAHDAAYASDHGVLAGAKSCFWCAMNRANCALDATLICGLAVDVTPVGDIQSIGGAGIAYWSGTEIDLFDASLAGVGLASTLLLQPQFKIGAGLLKTARAARSLSRPLEDNLLAIMRQGFHADRLPRRLSDVSLTNAKKLMDPTTREALWRVASDVGKIQSHLPTNRALMVLRQIDSPDEARDIALVTEAMDKRTPAAFEALGKKRVLAAVRRPARLAIEAALAFASLVAALWLMVGHIFWSATLRALRRLARKRPADLS